MRKAFWEHVRRFGSWFEFEAAALADARNENEIAIELSPEGTIASLRIGTKVHDHKLDGSAELWAFLGSLGVRRIELDARLERNQIEDVIGLLHCHRRGLEKGNTGAATIAGQLRSDQGVHVACTETSLTNHTLAIRYSYCTLRFSRVVHWFEQRNRKFHDHRTLFYVAPRYALLIGLLIGGPEITIAIVLGHWFFAAGLALATLFIMGLTYVFFTVVGSVEYDNEEKAYNLRRAYGQLREYTDRIQTDIKRARTVQETFLPDPQHMPFRDRIEWGASFAPAEEVGGDYFDVAELDETRAAILFSDVSGHGMGAAFITAIIKTTFRAWLDQPDTLEGLAGQINANLLRLVPLGSFAAVFLAIYDVSTRELTYANCGHQPEPWRLCGTNGTPIASLSDARNLVMGIQEQATIATSSVTLAAGDTVLFVSDGIVENPNVDNQYYGTVRFSSFVQSKKALAPTQLVEAITNEARLYSDGTEQSDDRTVLALRIRS